MVIFQCGDRIISILLYSSVCRNLRGKVVIIKGLKTNYFMYVFVSTELNIGGKIKRV